MIVIEVLSSCQSKRPLFLILLNHGDDAVAVLSLVILCVRYVYYIRAPFDDIEDWHDVVIRSEHRIN